jgi:hypothetical protein
MLAIRGNARNFFLVIQQEVAGANGSFKKIAPNHDAKPVKVALRRSWPVLAKARRGPIIARFSGALGKA